MKRRTFLKGAAALSVTGGAAAVARSPKVTKLSPDGWDTGEVLHILPTANHERFRIKTSFRETLLDDPILEIGSHKVPGRATDSGRRFFTFDTLGRRSGADTLWLAPDRQYRLRLVRGSGAPLCEAWPLRTFPAPNSEVERFRLLTYTCAGGPDNLYNFGFFNAYLPNPHRQRLLLRGLSFAPDAIVANGDHIYWDLKSKFGWALGNSLRARWLAGRFDRSASLLGTENEGILQRAFGPQIADLYGVLFRSTPTFFLQDDHDYAENDEASDALRTFPPDSFMIDLARATQSLYYPELLPDRHFPAHYVNRDAVAESFGSIRYGTMFEALLYDCRRYIRNARDPATGDKDSGFVPKEIEHWLLQRTQQSPCAHLAHIPSVPILWTAGKWAEWYPDFKDSAGRLRADVLKPYWAKGWQAQHNRLIYAAHERRDRTPLFMSGDLHALAIGSIEATEERNLSANPVVSILTGPIGTGALGFPSKFRGQLPIPSGTLDTREMLQPLEQNGFCIADFTREALSLRLYAWSPEQGEDAIADLEPISAVTLPRP